MKKDLILITSFVPDEKRKQMLRNLVYSINKDNFDIIVSSHTNIPDDIFDKLDYFIYEKNNELDFDISHKFYFYFENQNFIVTTTEPKKYNHFKPVIRHIISGLSYAKTLGYKKVHYFEYDSLVINDSELIENSKLLDEYSAIYYKPPHMSYPNSPISFNIDKISDLWFNLDDNNFDKFLNSKNSSKLVEEYEWQLLTKYNNIFEKKFEDLHNKGIKAALNFDLENNKWIVPLYDIASDCISIFSWVENLEDVNSQVCVIVNEEKVFKLDRNMKGLWSLKPIGTKNEVKKITIIVNDVVKNSYDFSKISMENYIKHNNIQTKKR